MRVKNVSIALIEGTTQNLPPTVFCFLFQSKTAREHDVCIIRRYVAFEYKLFCFSMLKGVSDGYRFPIFEPPGFVPPSSVPATAPPMVSSPLGVICPFFCLEAYCGRTFLLVMGKPLALPFVEPPFLALFPLPMTPDKNGANEMVGVGVETDGEDWGGDDFPLPVGYAVMVGAGVPAAAKGADVVPPF